jgi:toxin-antitoxin system PIN domain toxin
MGILILADVNILINAFRPDGPSHRICRSWLEKIIEEAEPFCVSPQVLSAVVRITTNPRIYRQPTHLVDALAFANAILEHPQCRLVRPGPLHWGIFCDLCRKANATGNLVTDAWFAALAIEHGCEWITDDRDYARFPGLRWRSPSGDAVQ